MKKVTALSILLALTLSLCACKSTAARWQEQYDLGVRYLSDGSYEEAILAFNAAIEIDPMQAETYEKLADAYLAQFDVEMALQTLRDGYAATGDARLQSRIDDLTKPKPAASSGTEFVIENGVLVKYNGSGGEVTIPAEVTKIGERAFENCTRMTRVVFPKHSYSIDSYAFYGCTGLTYIENNGGIGPYAFAGCTGLTYIENSGGIGPYAFAGCTGLTHIENSGGISPYAFAGCTGLTYIENSGGIGPYAFAGCTGLTEVMNSGEIGSYAFAGCTTLSQIWIPSVSIGSNAFSQCTSLTDVHYSGTQAQWAAMTIDEGNEALLSATIHFNS